MLDDMGFAVGLRDLGLGRLGAALDIGRILRAEVGWVGDMATLLLAVGRGDASAFIVVDLAGVTDSGGGEASDEREEGERETHFGGRFVADCWKCFRVLLVWIGWFGLLKRRILEGDGCWIYNFGIHRKSTLEPFTSPSPSLL